MTRRICTCGKTIVCAELDRWPIWLEPVGPGRGTHRLHGNKAALDLNGGHAKHHCSADPQPVILEPAPRSAGQAAPLYARNSGQIAAGAARNTAAAQAVLNSGRRLTDLEQRIAAARVARPNDRVRELAAATGDSPSSVQAALNRIRDYARQLNNRTTT